MLDEENFQKIVRDFKKMKILEEKVYKYEKMQDIEINQFERVSISLKYLRKILKEKSKPFNENCIIERKENNRDKISLNDREYLLERKKHICERPCNYISDQDFWRYLYLKGLNLGSGYDDFFDKNLCEIINTCKSLGSVGNLGIRNPLIIDGKFIEKLKIYLDEKINNYLYDKNNSIHTMKIFNEYLKWHNRNSSESCKIDFNEDEYLYIVVSHYPDGVIFPSEYEWNGWLYSYLLLSNLSSNNRDIIKPRKAESRYRLIKVKKYEINLYRKLSNRFYISNGLEPKEIDKLRTAFELFCESDGGNPIEYYINILEKI